MNTLSHIEICNGLEKKSEIESFYEREGSSIDICSSDLFFIAYAKKEIMGCVRFCVDNQIPMLRTMRVAGVFQKQKVGLELLRRFAVHLNDGDIHGTYCLPHAHLESFYAQVGFRKISEEETPPLLRQRIKDNEAKGYSLICMKRD